MFRILGWAIALLLAGAANGQADGGEALIAELGCPVCHLDLAIESPLLSRAPSLEDAGLRYRTSYLFEYLGSPRSIRRHIGKSRMPDFDLSEAERVALALFLATRKKLPPLPPLPSNLDQQLNHTEQLRDERAFERLSQKKDCTACHSRNGTGGQLGPELDGVGARLQASWLRRFLVAPEAWGLADGVMPALFLRPNANRREPTSPAAVQQLRQMVDHLERSSRSQQRHLDQDWEEAQTRHPQASASIGRRVYQALDCAGCHPIEGIEPPGPAPRLSEEARRVRSNWLRSYLTAPMPIRPFGTRPGSGSRMPNFRLTAQEVGAIAEFLESKGPTERKSLPAPLSAYQEKKVELLLERKLSCRGCHRIAGRGGRVGPELAGLNERLQASFVEEMLADPEGTVSHTTMPQPILTTETRTKLATYLLSLPPPEQTAPYLSPATYATIALPQEPVARDYARYCAPCHGATGSGNGYNAGFLPTRPTVHADAKYMAERADDTLYDGIYGGGAILAKSHLMPAWGSTLSPRRIEDLVDYLRDLCQCTQPSWAASTPSALAEPSHHVDGKPATPIQAANSQAGTAPPPHAPRAMASEEVQAKAAPNFDDFVGAKACAPCHREAYDFWAESTHGKAGGVPDEVELIARFDDKPLHFRGAVVIPTLEPDGRPKFIVRQKGQPKKVIEVDAVIGGGHMLGGGTQAFFTKWDDGTLRMLPFDFIRDENTWFVQRGIDSRWVIPGPEIGLAELEHWPPHRVLGPEPSLSNCENCHGSQIEIQFDSTTGQYSTRMKTLKIDCEACHGPGREHLDWAKDEDRDDQSSIGMAALELHDKEASLATCLRCHANKALLTPGLLPTESAEERHLAMKLPMLVQAPYLTDGRIDGFGYQQNHLFSSCFLDGSMVCTDCHDPHTQNYRDIHGNPLFGRFDDGQCTGCHAAKAREDSAHTLHALGSPGSRCTSCHMPFLQHQTVGSEFKFARSDHTIPIPRPEFDEELGIENACAKCHPESTTSELQRQVDEGWGPIKPHPPMIRRLLAAGQSSDRSQAATLLLAPDTEHLMGKMAGLTTYIRKYLTIENIPPLDPTERENLRALANDDDPDIAATALLALHLAHRAPEPFLTTPQALAGLTRPGIRARWHYGLSDLSRVLHQSTRRSGALRTQQKLLELEKSERTQEAHVHSPTSTP